MAQQIQIIGLTLDEASTFIRGIVMDCLKELKLKPPEDQLSIEEACNLLGISPPTLKKFVDQGKIRRHDLGDRTKVFYRSELEADIRSLRQMPDNELK